MTNIKQQDVNPAEQAKTSKGVNNTKEASAPNASPTKTNTEKLDAEIKRTWSKLTDEEIGFSEKDEDGFHSALKQKYGLSKEDAEKRMKEIRSSCGCASRE